MSFLLFLSLFLLFFFFFFEFCSQYIWHFEGVLISAQNVFNYIEFICRKTCEKKLFHVFRWFPGLQNLDGFSENLLWSKFWNHFQVKTILYSLLFFDFLIVFLMVWKNQKSREPWLVGICIDCTQKDFPLKMCQKDITLENF